MTQESTPSLVRNLQYRLQRQGMLELDAWLSPLQDALQSGDEKVITSIEQLLTYEVPELLNMQSGNIDIPQELKPWLDI